MSSPDVRLIHLAERLHQLGPGVLAYLLAELEAGADVRIRAERYAALPADFIRANGGSHIAKRLVSINGGRS
jgi:hypothetical protein